MSAARGPRAPWLALTLALVACEKGEAPPPTTTPEPEPAVTAAEPEPELPFEKNTFVSTSRNEPTDAPADIHTLDEEEDDEQAAALAAQYTVTTPERVREVAEAAVADQLDETKSWMQSPVMPASWPAKDHAVAVFFYPMASNPGSLTEHQVYSAAFKVTVVLTDGSAEVSKLGKGKRLGTIKQSRPSSLERRELEMAEEAMVKQMMGVDPELGAKPYWGYLKFVHEHEKIGRDLERRQPAFFKWLRKKHGR